MKLLCPVCHNLAGELDEVGNRCSPCAHCGFCFQKVDGIVRAIAPDRRPVYDRFLSDYGTIRKAEGRGSNSRDYYLALPYRDLSERNSEQWRIRACTYRYFEKNLLQETSLDILDPRRRKWLDVVSPRPAWAPARRCRYFCRSPGWVGGGARIRLVSVGRGRVR